MASMRLSQLISGLKQEAGHTLDLVLCSDQMNGDLKMGGVMHTPLPWSDQYLVPLHRGPGYYIMSALGDLWIQMVSKLWLLRLGSLGIDRIKPLISKLCKS